MLMSAALVMNCSAASRFAGTLYHLFIPEGCGSHATTVPGPNCVHCIGGIHCMPKHAAGFFPTKIVALPTRCPNPITPIAFPLGTENRSENFGKMLQHEKTR